MMAEARRFGCLLLFAAAALVAFYQRPSDVFLSFGPNDGPYVEGFREDFEIDEPTFIHWSSEQSRVRLPFHLNGPFDVTLRFKRHIATSATLRFYVAGSLIETLVVPQQDFTVRRFRSDETTGGPFELQILSSSEDPRPLGIALDWMLIQPAARWGAIFPSVIALASMLSWVAAFYAIPRALGLGTRVSLTSGATVALALATLAWVNKLWPIHASMVLGVRAHVIVALAVAFFWWRRRSDGSVFQNPQARWALYIAIAAFGVRVFALFHPDFYYPDIRTHSKFVYLIWSEGLGGLFDNYIESQHRHLLGLQLVGARWVAFPYPPLLYLSLYPLSLLRLPVEDWMKIIPTALVMAESLLVYAAAIKLGVGQRAAAVALLLHSTARVVGFRLAVASYAALFGHFWDTLAMTYLVFFFERMRDKRYLAGWAALVAVSLLSYAGSVLVLGMLVPGFCIAFLIVPRAQRPEPARLWAIALWALGAALVALGVFYGRYIPEILTHPAAAGGTNDLVELSLTPLAAIRMGAHRLNLFYSVFGAAALIGLALFRAKLERPLGFAIVIAAIATYAGLNFLRAGLGATHIFQFSKDDLVILPVIVVTLGAMIVRNSRTGWGRAVSAVVIAGWIGWSGVRFSHDIRSRFFRPEYPPVSVANVEPAETYADAYSTRLPPARFAR